MQYMYFHALSFYPNVTMIRQTFSLPSQESYVLIAVNYMEIKKSADSSQKLIFADLNPSPDLLAISYAIKF